MKVGARSAKPMRQRSSPSASRHALALATLLAAAPPAAQAASVVTSDPQVVAQFQQGAYVLGFDQLPPNGGGGQFGQTGTPIQPASQLGTQYQDRGALFSSTGGPAGVVGLQGLPNQGDAKSPYNVIGGSDPVGGTPRLNYFEPIVIDFVAPGTSIPASTARVGAWNDPTGSRIRLDVLDDQGALIESVEAGQGLFIGIQAAGIARAVFSYVTTQSIPGFSLDDVTFAPVTGSAGEVSDNSLDVEMIAGDLSLSWAASCLATDDDYEIYEGTIGSYYSHTPRFCSTGGQTSITFPLPTGDAYYLVVPRNGVREGGYGRTSAMTPRPASPLACLPQQVTPCP